jgi:hypothetical protein
MMHFSKKLLAGGDQGYFNVKRPVNVRTNGTNAHAMRVIPSKARFLRSGCLCGARDLLFCRKPIPAPSASRVRHTPGSRVGFLTLLFSSSP